MPKPSKDHGIAHEPALNGVAGPDPDKSEAKADRVLAKAAEKDKKQAHEHSVFDELAFLPEDLDRPARIDRDFACAGCGYNLRGLILGQPCPECDYVQYERPSSTDKEGYAQWLVGKLASTSPVKTWAVTLGVVLLSGVWAVLGSFLKANVGGGGFFAVAVWGPVTEEVMKVALIAVVIERAPYLFSARAQILLAAIGSGLMFAVIENFLYLFVYIDNPDTTTVIWRWTVCVALHVGCTLLAGVGAVVVWRRQMAELRRVPMPIDIRYLVAAIVIHGVYNGTVTLLQVAGAAF